MIHNIIPTFIYTPSIRTSLEFFRDILSRQFIRIEDMPRPLLRLISSIPSSPFPTYPLRVLLHIQWVDIYLLRTPDTFGFVGAIEASFGVPGFGRFLLGFEVPYAAEGGYADGFQAREVVGQDVDITAWISAAFEEDGEEDIGDILRDERARVRHSSQGHPQPQMGIGKLKLRLTGNISSSVQKRYPFLYASSLEQTSEKSVDSPLARCATVVSRALRSL